MSKWHRLGEVDSPCVTLTKYFASLIVLLVRVLFCDLSLAVSAVTTPSVDVRLTVAVNV